MEKCFEEGLFRRSFVDERALSTGWLALSIFIASFSNGRGALLLLAMDEISVSHLLMGYPKPSSPSPVSSSRPILHLLRHCFLLLVGDAKVGKRPLLDG